MYNSKKRNKYERNKTKKKQLNPKFKKKYCSPNNPSNKFTCFKKASLIKIIDSWNLNYINNKIKYTGKESTINLWKKIDNKFKKSCINEACWLNQDIVKNINSSDIKNSFKPLMPKSWYNNKNEWLSTSDIRNVLKQYELKLNNFIFIGPVPIDFDLLLSPGFCVANELCNIDLKNLLNKNKTRIGIVFNLDTHDMSGSHWVALFINLEENNIMYFDSIGNKPYQEVYNLISRLEEQAKKIKIKFNIYINEVQHQYKGTECGVYCINFIIKLLEGKKFESIVQKIEDDDTMEKNRLKFFIKY